MGSREVQISVMLAWPWHQGCAKTTAPQIIRQRESERILAVAHQSSTRKHRLTQKQTWTQTEGLRLFELVVSVRVWCMARQKERALQSYHREHSGPKPASVAWHLYPGGLPTEPPVPVTLIWREITYQVFITVHMDTVQTHLLFQFKVQKLGLGTKFLLKRSFWKVTLQFCINRTVLWRVASFGLMLLCSADTDAAAFAEDGKTSLDISHQVYFTHPPTWSSSELCECGLIRLDWQRANVHSTCQIGFKSLEIFLKAERFVPQSHSL